MNNKSKFLFIAITLFFSSVCINLSAQTKNKSEQNKNKYDTIFELTDKKCSIKDNKINLDIDLLVSGHHLTKNETVIFTPIYISKNDKIYFKTIVVSGRRVGECKFRKRWFVEEYKKDNPEILTTYNKKDVKKYADGKMLKYNITEPFPSDLPLDGKIKIEKVYSRCYDVKKFEPEYINLHQEIAVLPEVELNNLTFFIPEKEVVKNRQASATLFIQYKLNKANIEPNLANNRLELEKINKLLSPITSNKECYKANKINLSGYASPEGTYKHNLDLSQRRSNAVAKYINDKYEIKGIELESIGYGEDWEGLIPLVEKDDNVPLKGDVIRIIKYVEIFQGREKQLMELDKGNPYRYILKNHFPELRRTKVELDYTVRPFTEEEIAEIYQTRPQDLSQKEIYIFASKNNQEIKNRSAFGEEYIKAAELFPDDPIANINAANASLIRHNVEAAKAYLSKVENDPRAFNSIGVLYMLIGEKDKALEYLNNVLKLDSDSMNASKSLIENNKKAALRNINFYKQ